MNRLLHFVRNDGSEIPLHFPNFHINNQWILAQRGEKNQVEPNKPYAFLIEKDAVGRILREALDAQEVA